MIYLVDNHKILQINRVLDNLCSWVIKNGYRDWDPYDWYLSPLSKKLPYKLNWILSQLNVYSPWNMRKFFKIKKGINPKALGLFSQGFFYYYLSRGNMNAKKEALRILDMLLKLKKETNNKVWWENYFEFERKYHKISINQPDFGAISQGLKAFSLGYKITKFEIYAEISNKILNTLEEDFIAYYNKYIFIKYYPKDTNKLVFNISGITLSSLSYYIRYVKYSEDIIRLGKSLSVLLIDSQEADGKWPYSYIFSENKFHYQIDFHQGFILEGLLDFLPLIRSSDISKEIEEKIRKGLEFYKNYQFTPQGRSKFRIPWTYPVDIHNQAQGIITFSKAYKVLNEKSYLDFAMKIAEWTIKNMLSPEGYFYTHRWPFMINKIPYMRWGQAWMLLALSTLLSIYRGE